MNKLTIADGGYVLERSWDLEVIEGDSDNLVGVFDVDTFTLIDGEYNRSVAILNTLYTDVELNGTVYGSLTALEAAFNAAIEASHGGGGGGSVNKVNFYLYDNETSIKDKSGNEVTFLDILTELNDANKVVVLNYRHKEGETITEITPLTGGVGNAKIQFTGILASDKSTIINVSVAANGTVTKTEFNCASRPVVINFTSDNRIVVDSVEVSENKYTLLNLLVNMTTGLNKFGYVNITDSLNPSCTLYNITSNTQGNKFIRFEGLLEKADGLYNVKVVVKDDDELIISETKANPNTVVYEITYGTDIPFSNVKRNGVAITDIQQVPTDYHNDNVQTIFKIILSNSEALDAKVTLDSSVNLVIQAYKTTSLIGAGSISGGETIYRVGFDLVQELVLGHTFNSCYVWSGSEEPSVIDQDNGILYLIYEA